jgi:hypothetical protein
MPCDASLVGRSARYLGALLVVCGAACNVILDNQPGLLDEEGAAPTAETDDAGARDRGRSSQGQSDEDDAAAAPVVGPGPGPDAAAADGEDAGGASCAPGTKACGGACVSSSDPQFGCGDDACEPCALPNAVPACMPGGCAVLSCAVGFADCNAEPSDGCEADLASPETCGACGIACPVLKNVTMSCVAGTCSGACEAGFADCNADPDDGCERNLRKDKRNCGACGVRCTIGRCEEGACVWP